MNKSSLRYHRTLQHWILFLGMNGMDYAVALDTLAVQPVFKYSSLAVGSDYIPATPNVTQNTSIQNKDKFNQDQTDEQQTEPSTSDVEYMRGY